MNRRAAIAALLTAVPGLSFAATEQIKWSKAGDAPRYYAVLRPDGCLEIPLDGWTGWRVTFNSESIEISAAELFEALRPQQPYAGPPWGTLNTSPVGGPDAR